jgi:ferric-dicitrate binding protein FerR (iron transport regulator)
MTVSTFASRVSDASGESGEYRPGVCNIGPAEIARRRMAGHVGLVATAALLAILIVIGAPSLTRLLVILPVAISASGYLQARLKFCAGFGSRGIFNFGAVGGSATVADAEARAIDRRRSRQISLWALGIGVIVGAVAALLPI